MQQTYEDQQQQYKSLDFLQQQYQWLEEHALGMANWATDISTNLYVEPLNYNPHFQVRFD